MTEKPKEYSVVCISHGLIGKVAQAALGLTLFEAHRQRVDSCIGAKISPIPKDISFLQRKQMRRITNSGKK